MISIKELLKKLYFICLFIVGSVYAQSYFTMKIDTTKDPKDSLSFYLPVSSSCTYTLKNDSFPRIKVKGVYLENNNRNILVPQAGIYTLKIISKNKKITLDNQKTPDEKKAQFIELSNWGKASIYSDHAFYNFKNLKITAHDVPKIKTCSYFFAGCTSIDTIPGIEHWNMSEITDMSGFFKKVNLFNQDISNWKTSKVRDMSFMFFGANAFNQNISTWDTSNVVYLNSMFAGATKFNQDLNTWDISKVTHMSGLFSSAKSFDGAIGQWNTSKVKDMSSLFSMATKFNQNISTWDTSKVENMYAMFFETRSFNQDISNWDTSSVRNMGLMFYGTGVFDAPIGKWDTSNVTNMELMFANDKNFNQALNGWDTSKVTNMNGMFTGASSFNQDLSNWDTSKVHDMDLMFANAKSFNQNIGIWDISNTDDIINLSFTGLDCTNYSNTLKEWASNDLIPTGIKLMAKDLKYSNEAITSRDILHSKGWIIIGDSYDSSCNLTQEPQELEHPETDAKNDEIMNNHNLQINILNSDDPIG